MHLWGGEPVGRINERNKRLCTRDAYHRRSLGASDADTAATIRCVGGACKRIDELFVRVVSCARDSPRGRGTRTAVREQGEKRRFRNRESRALLGREGNL